MEKKLIPGIGQGKYKMSLEPLVPEARKYSKNERDTSKGTRDQIKGDSQRPTLRHLGHQN